MSSEVLCKIFLGSHFFKITHVTPRMSAIILEFARQFIQYNTYAIPTSRFSNVKDAKPDYKVFAGKTQDNSEFRFHIGQWSLFLKHLGNRNITENLYELYKLPLYTPEKVSWKFNPKYELRDYQNNSKNFILEPRTDDNLSRLVSIYTGGGKTVVAAAAMGTIAERTVIVVLPAYIEKWAGDVQNLLGLKPKEIMVIQGSKDLTNLIAFANDPEFTQKVVIISLKTLQNFHKAFEQLGRLETIDQYGCTPDELFCILKAGILLIDEAHQWLHAIFKTLIYAHVPRVIALSATFTTDDEFVENIQHIMFPAEIRYDKVKMEKYIKAYPISYQLQNIEKNRIVTTEQNSTVYSHNAFERSILRNKYVLPRYLDLIAYVVDLGYINDYLDKDKCIIFAASKAMCEAIVAKLKTKYPNYDIRRYVEEDPYENVMEGDIIATTVLSAGTALDIPNLRVTVMTTNILNSVTNYQALGRLRNLSDRDVKYYYTYCENIPKQKEYHYKRKEIFKDRVASIKEFRYPYAI